MLSDRPYASPEDLALFISFFTVLSVFLCSARFVDSDQRCLVCGCPWSGYRRCALTLPTERKICGDESARYYDDRHPYRQSGSDDRCFDQNHGRVPGSGKPVADGGDSLVGILAAGDLLKRVETGTGGGPPSRLLDLVFERHQGGGRAHA
jgi:hypothetical protein